MKVTEEQLRRQISNLKLTALYALMEQSSKKYKLPLAYVLAIGSRETNLVNKAGDVVKGVPQGRGIMQIDIKSHPWAKESSFEEHPEKFIDAGCEILSSNLKSIRKKFPKYTLEQQLKVAASAYNTGPLRAFAGSRVGNSDLFTTGKDYGKDVMERMAAIQKLI